MKTTKTTKRASKTSEYTVTIKSYGRKYSEIGSTVAEALGKLKAGKVRGTALITVTKGGVIREKIVNGLLIDRIFNAGGVTREIAIKNTSLMFDGI